MIEIHTDGSCLENPGNGGWAAIINVNGNIKKISGSEKNTTNNRMELMAPINALKSINSDSEIKIYIGSRMHPESIVYREKNRKLFSKVFSFLKKILINSEINDTMGSFVAEATTLKQLYLYPRTKKFFYVLSIEFDLVRIVFLS